MENTRLVESMDERIERLRAELNVETADPEL
jgi:hypothetical protein